MGMGTEGKFLFTVFDDDYDLIQNEGVGIGDGVNYIEPLDDDGIMLATDQGIYVY